MGISPPAKRPFTFTVKKSGYKEIYTTNTCLFRSDCSVSKYECHSKHNQCLVTCFYIKSIRRMWKLKIKSIVVYHHPIRDKEHICSVSSIRDNTRNKTALLSPIMAYASVTKI